MKILKLTDGKRKDDEISLGASFGDVTKYLGDLDIDVESIYWMKDWAKEKIKDDKFREILDYDGLSMWWFMESWLFYSYLYHDSWKEVLHHTKLIQLILDKEKPEEVVYVGKSGLYARVLEIFCKDRKINLKIEGNLSSDKNMIKRFLAKMFVRFKPVIRKMFYSFGKKIESSDIIFIDYDWGPSTLDLIASHVEGERVAVARGEKLSLNMGNLPCFEKYLSFSMIRETKKKVAELKRKWSEISDMDAKYCGIDIWPLLKNQIDYYFKYRLYGHLLDYEISKNMVSSIKPKVVFMSTTYTPWEIGMIAACKKNGTRSVNLQPGNMSKHYPSYIHKKGEVSKNLKFPFCPVPDKMCVFGDFDKEFLIKEGDHPVDVPYVSGVPRYDKYVEKVNKSEVLKEIGLSGRKIVMLATQNIPSIDERKDILKSVYNSVKDMNVDLIVKIHRGEGNYKMHQKLAQEMGIKNVIFFKEYDLLKLLSVCDVLITYFSTVGLEAMIFDKPVVILNISGMPDQVDYVKKGVALGVYKSEELKDAINKSLNDKKTIEIMRKRRRKYVFNHCYKIDGKASERIAALIKKLSK